MPDLRRHLRAALIAACGCSEPAQALDAAPPPRDPSRRCTTALAFPDPDGDGYHARDGTEAGVEVCVEDDPPAGYAVHGGDCAEGDAAAWRSTCIDQDGDGAVSTGGPCAGAELPPGAGPCPFVIEWTPDPGPYDCNDSSADRVDYFYRDADGDGAGAGEGVCHRPEAGWSARDNDCDDADASRSPYAVEYFGDEQDSDCNGSDGATCTPVALEQLAWPDPSDGGCSGPDLAIAVMSCASCYSRRATVAVENRGATNVETDVLLHTELGAINVAVRLAAGERRLLLGGPFGGPITLAFADSNTADCHPDDNTAFAEYGHCI